MLGKKSSAVEVFADTVFVKSSTVEVFADTDFVKSSAAEVFAGIFFALFGCFAAEQEMLQGLEIVF